jgi:thioesterase domain-containing protein
MRMFGRLYRSYVANMQALVGYVPQPYHGYIASFEYTEQPHTRRNSGWEDLSRGRFERYDISGTHMTLMRQPHVKLLAQKLNRCLNSERQAVPAWSSEDRGRKIKPLNF